AVHASVLRVAPFHQVKKRIRNSFTVMTQTRPAFPWCIARSRPLKALMPPQPTRVHRPASHCHEGGHHAESEGPRSGLLEPMIERFLLPHLQCAKSPKNRKSTG